MKKSFGRITQHGFLVQSPGVSFSKMRVLGSYALVFLTRGGGTYRLGKSDPLPCSAGDVLVVFPEIPHGYGPESGGCWDESYLVFDGPVFDLWRQNGWLSMERPILSPRPQGRFAGNFRKIVETDTGGSPADELRRICALQVWLADAMHADARQDKDENSVFWPAWMSAAVRFMQEHPTASLEEIAGACKLTAETFRKKFRTHAGVPAIQYRDRLMVGLAQKLIYEERLSNKEIAERLGICDEFHFSKRFRHVAGSSPSTFRRSLNAKP
jgi:AraC-like DNA-binding protein